MIGQTQTANKKAPYECHFQFHPRVRPSIDVEDRNAGRIAQPTSAAEDRDSNEPTRRSDRLLDPWDTVLMNRHQAELNGLSGGSSFAMIGSVGAFLVGTVFLGAACFHWRFCASHPATLPVRRQSVRFTFARSNPVFP